MTFRVVTRSWLPVRRFSTIASGASMKCAKSRARFELPMSGETTTGDLSSFCLK